MTCTVILSAYNNFPLLEKVLWGYEAQTESEFTILIADDGSDENFIKQLANFRATSPLRIAHIRQEKAGFGKCRILNTAICASKATYLIFSDADFIPRADFVAAHLHFARRGHFVSGGGGHVDIPMDVQGALTADAVRGQQPFDAQWLRAHGLSSLRTLSRVSLQGIPALIADALTPRPNAFVGCNASVFRDDVVAVRGFDETLVYGGLDRDLGVRLANAGVTGKQRKYSLAGVHLAHPRPYRDESVVAAQKALFRERARTKVILPNRGISENLLDGELECMVEIEQ